MVRAILDGRKTQTRRILRDDWKPGLERVWMAQVQQRCWEYSPYGAPGDRLWVRETWRTAKVFNEKSPSAIAAMALDANYDRAWGPASYAVDGTDNGVSLADFGGEWGKKRV